MNVLVLSAHPDDETLGCGGTLLKHRAAGDQVSWIVATTPVGPRWPDGLADTERALVAKVAAAYGMTSVHQLGLPSTELESLPRNTLIDALRPAFEGSAAEIVYVVHRGDAHSDHRVLFEAFSIVSKPFKRYGLRRVQMYECLSSTDAAPPFPERMFIPNVYSDITSFLEGKLDIMRLYEAEMQEETQPRSESAIRALARLRGATIGVSYAEAFMLVREIL